VWIIRRLSCSTGHGYVEVKWAISKLPVPIAETAVSISLMVDMPVDMMRGRPVAFIALSSGVSVSDALADL
jgi:hypothetical protein